MTAINKKQSNKRRSRQLKRSLKRGGSSGVPEESQNVLEQQPQNVPEESQNVLEQQPQINPEQIQEIFTTFENKWNSIEKKPNESIPDIPVEISKLEVLKTNPNDNNAKKLIKTYEFCDWETVINNYNTDYNKDNIDEMISVLTSLIKNLCDTYFPPQSQRNKEHNESSPIDKQATEVDSLLQTGGKSNKKQKKINKKQKKTKKNKKQSIKKKSKK